MSEHKPIVPILDSLSATDIAAALLLLHGRYAMAARMLLFGASKAPDLGSGVYACPTCHQRFDVSDKRNAHVREAHSPRAAAPRET